MYHCIVYLFTSSLKSNITGAIHLHDCPLQDLVPIWLIVSGVAPIFFGGSARKQGDDGDESQSPARSVCGVIGLIFNLAWLICGSLWVYPTFGTVNNDDFVPCIGNVTTGCSQDCHKPTLTFAFAMVTIDWIFFVFWFITTLCSFRAICSRSRGGAQISA
ncbi:hypothetical protein MAR_016007 [Mya arenaria]|uniref:Uncharacterized protein n=1 Tax=Mya arenaria TaxID=6604 RepID=A0ABY7FKU4_MYAAR|nr:transmembrane protein 272-like [Mya arenaria]XP_052770675.1 transmembrane protein 272-like [Mya arenaria]XP_052772886.1 transmembrane protein 272-like [Mya arenaria]XP_052772887.1 transmembrane protein 272-like [Mya arenaria]WAR21955.1 hypothetical protein MAR_015929 [Mya arenaria]WAR21959.1 hypothetical protein MAR_015933 [Mya arenaria]WAR22020.1 hypothetical protein MAR_015994 [Mya arenaria]WAR22033.1 hypothetical protein MAR_016007 [Mya arenaria]